MTKGKGRNPGASNLDKHLKRTVHHERSQPAARQRLGQLEKRKDHVLRAQRRKLKGKRLLELKRAVAQRNPDEFHIGMTKAVMDVATGSMKKRKRRLQPDERASQLKQTLAHNTRNVQYLEYKAQSDRIRLKDLLQEDATAAITAAAPQNKHIVFVESEEEFKSFNPQVYFDATKEMLVQHPAVRGRLSVLQDTVLPDEVLLSGGMSQVLKSVNQRRKERREIQKKLHAVGNDPEARSSLLEKIQARRDLKRYHRFDELLAEDLRSRGGEEGEDDRTDGHNVDDVTLLLQGRRQQQKQKAIETARRVKEMSQRLERSKSLRALAKTIRRQNAGLQKQITQKKDSRFKPTAPRRAP